MPRTAHSRAALAPASTSTPLSPCPPVPPGGADLFAASTSTPLSPCPPVPPGGADLFAASCPTRSVLDHITSRWGSLALVLLLQHPFRFSQLARHIGGVSEKMLAQTLRALERDGFVARTVLPTKPPQVTYSLTPMGEQAATRLQALTSWVEANLSRVLAHRGAHPAA